jgi:hypothetical protein
MLTFGLLFSAVGSGVLLVVVLVALAELEVEALAAAVLVAAVAPADGAVCTPAAVGWLLPQPATTAASASAAQVIDVVLGMLGGETSEHHEEAPKDPDPVAWPR